MTADCYGVDIAARRADDLDRALVTAVAEQVAQGKSPTVLDLGSGSGGQAARLAAAGAAVTAVDLGPYQDSIAAYNEQLPVTAAPIEFVQADAYAYLTSEEKRFDFVLLQRMLHYLPYAAALQLLRTLSERSNHLYVSVTGATSAIGAVHPAPDAALADRFLPLPRDAAETFSVTAPLCVYTHEEFCTVLTASGWQIEQSWQSAFGNSKAIAHAKSQD